MTEIPEHLLRRAQQARERAGLPPYDIPTPTRSPVLPTPQGWVCECGGRSGEGHAPDCALTQPVAPQRVFPPPSRSSTRWRRWEVYLRAGAVAAAAALAVIALVSLLIWSTGGGMTQDECWAKNGLYSEKSSDCYVPAP